MVLNVFLAEKRELFYDGEYVGVCKA